MVDSYLEKLHQLEEEHGKYKKTQEVKKRYEDFKSGYKRINQKDVSLSTIEHLKFKKKGDKILTKEGNNPWQELDPHNKGAYLSVASKLMSIHSPLYALEGAKIYEGLGVGNRTSVKRRLLQAYQDQYPNENDNHIKKEIEAYLKRNPESKQSGKTLEHKFISVIAGASIIIALFFLSSNLTGNVVGNLAKSDSNIIGAILFVLGIIGLFISFRRE